MYVERGWRGWSLGANPARRIKGESEEGMEKLRRSWRSGAVSAKQVFSGLDDAGGMVKPSGAGTASTAGQVDDGRKENTDAGRRR